MAFLLPPLNAVHLSDTDYPSIQASHSFNPKSRLPVAAGVNPARVPTVIPPSPSPPDFLSSYTISQFCFELPNSISEVGVSLGRLVSSSPQSEKMVCVSCEPGPLGPTPPLDDSLPGVLGSSGSGAAVVSDEPLSRSCSPCQGRVIPSIGMSGELLVSANSLASSSGDLGPSCDSDPQGTVLLPNGNELVCSCSQGGAPVIPTSSPAHANPLGTGDSPPGVLWSSVVKKNSLGDGNSDCWCCFVVGYLRMYIPAEQSGYLEKPLAA